MRSHIEFYSIDSHKFLENLAPITFISEALMTPKWLGSKALVVTYSYNISKDLQTIIKRSWKKRIKVFAPKNSCDLKIIVKPERNVTLGDLLDNSFIMYCTPSSCLFRKYIAGRVPIKLEGKKIIIGKSTYAGSGLQLSATILNPFNKKRFIALLIKTPILSKTISINKINEYSVDRYTNTIEKGSFESDGTGKIKGFKQKTKHPYDNDWLCADSDHYVLCVRPKSFAHNEIKQLIHIHEKAYSEIITALRMRPVPYKLLCFVHQGHYNDDESTYFKSGVIHTVYNEETKHTYGISHELVHAFMWLCYGSTVPLLGEGLAERLGSKFPRPIEFYTADLLYSNVLLPLDLLFEKKSFQHHFEAVTYMQSASFVKYIINKYGWRRFTYLLKNISGQKSKQDYSNIFLHIYNKSLKELEKDWRQHIAKYLDNHRDEILKVRSIWSAKRNIFYKNYTAALSDIENCFRKSTKDPEIYFLAGKLYFYKNDYQEAIKYFLKATEMLRQKDRVGFISRHSYLYLANIYDILGKRDMAISYYNLVLKYPEYDEVYSKAKRFLKTKYMKND